MQLTALYLPIEQPLIDGCTVINAAGEVSTWEEHRTDLILRVRRAAMFLVATQYNQNTIVGEPSRAALKFLKQGDRVKMVDCEPWVFDCDPHTPRYIAPVPKGTEPNAWYEQNIAPTQREFLKITWRIKCPHCQILH